MSMCTCMPGMWSRGPSIIVALGGGVLSRMRYMARGCASHLNTMVEAIHVFLISSMRLSRGFSSFPTSTVIPLRPGPTCRDPHWLLDSSPVPALRRVERCHAHLAVSEMQPRILRKRHLDAVDAQYSKSPSEDPELVLYPSVTFAAPTTGDLTHVLPARKRWTFS